MSKIKGYLLATVIVFVIQISFLSFAFISIENNGYNPTNYSCGKTCFKKLNVDVKLDEKGDATFVEEYRAYREKSGNYIYVDHEYDKAIGEEIDRASIKLLSGDGVLEPSFEKSGTKTQTRFKINTHFRGEATFKFSYRVKGLIKNLTDGQIFKYNFFNNTYASPVIDAKINIHLPSKVFKKSTLWFDGLKSQKFVQKNSENNMYVINVSNSNHTKGFYEVNMTFSKNAFVNSSEIPAASYSTIKQFNKEIDKVKEKDQLQVEHAKKTVLIFLIGTITALPIIILVFIIIYILKEKPYRKIDKETAYWNVPVKISPLAASMVMAKDNLTNIDDGFKADILYLVSNGYVRLETIGEEFVLTKLKDIEAESIEVVSLYQFLFNARDEVTISAYRGYGEEEQNLFKQYCEDAVKAFQKMDLYETPRGGYKGNLSMGLKFRVIGGAILILIVAIAIYSGLEFVAAAFASTVIITVFLISFLVTYTTEATRLCIDKIALYEQWNGYKNYLSNYTLLKERNISDIAVWKQHLAYATAFGVAENVLRVLKTEFPEIATSVEAEMPIGPAFYVGALVGRPSVSTVSSGGFGSFGSGGGFTGGGFSGGGSGGGGGGFG